jgi:hypothetical protein
MGTIFALMPHTHLEALPETITLPAPGMYPKLPAAAAQPPSPEWMKDLIIYEVATKGFTSPNGAGSGSFNSLRSNLVYLEDLGITGLWLTGYALCDPRHFYNIWTQYAVIDPGRLDPTLGTSDEFKKLVDEAHGHGIKIFLDVITHGLMKDSPIIQDRPTWFRGGSWGMTDFDWNGGHTDLDDWWVTMYTEFVTVYGVDGYRLDVGIFRPDLWERIRQNAAAAGHPIVIWEETNSVIPGVTDFTQRQNVISSEQGLVNEVLIKDLPGYYDRKFGRAGYYQVEVQYSDRHSVEGSTKGDGLLGVHLVGLSADPLSARTGEEPFKPDGLPHVQLRLQNLSQKPIANITVRNDMGDEWQLRGDGQARTVVVDVLELSELTPVKPQVDIYISTLAWGGSSIQLSCHDNGWEGFPPDKNPYVAQGSRSVFGYSFLFSPMIPIFFSGEEFDAKFHALPGLSPYLFGGKDPGRGRWLYGAELDWNDLSETEHRDMFMDVKKMAAIRKKHSKTLAMWPSSQAPNLKAVRYEADIDVPVPYVRWDDQSAIVVAANRARDRDAHLRLRISLTDIGLGGRKNYVVTDLWSTAATRTCTEAELNDFRSTIKCDGTRGGGLSVFKIEPSSSIS